MHVVILKPGLLDTIQDSGRYGFQHLGINPGGAMDLVAANIANLLVENEINNPVLELHFPASVFRFTQRCLIAITGADFDPEINGRPIPINTAILVSKDGVLKFKSYKAGARCYLAINGKWQINLWLNSYSTNTKAVAGGYKGRALRKDDVIDVDGKKWGIKSEANTTAIWPVKADNFTSPADNIIRCTRGSEFEWLSNDARDGFINNPFKITIQSDRMGYRLNGSVLESEREIQLLSTAVTRGTVQLLPSGQLIILMADHQTTGGYPKVAHVISADLSKLAQMRPNYSIGFMFIEHDEAENLFIKQQEYLQELQKNIQTQFMQIHST